MSYLRMNIIFPNCDLKAMQVEFSFMLFDISTTKIHMSILYIGMVTLTKIYDRSVESHWILLQIRFACQSVPPQLYHEESVVVVRAMFIYYIYAFHTTGSSSAITVMRTPLHYMHSWCLCLCSNLLKKSIYLMFFVCVFVYESAHVAKAHMMRFPYDAFFQPRSIKAERWIC